LILFHSAESTYPSWAQPHSQPGFRRNHLQRSLLLHRFACEAESFTFLSGIFVSGVVPDSFSPRRFGPGAALLANNHRCLFGISISFNLLYRRLLLVSSLSCTCLASLAANLSG